MQNEHESARMAGWARFCFAPASPRGVNSRAQRIHAWDDMDRPTLVLNPRGDSAFVSRTRALAAAVTSPTELESALRRAYPRARVVPRDLSGEYVTMWYVYRDGRWIRDARGAGGETDAELTRRPAGNHR